MRWEQGRQIVDDMVKRGELQRVSPNREHADELLKQARRHVSTSKVAAYSDPEGAYQLAYDAARKALSAILENQGLRATSRGGHIAVREAVTAQLDPPMGAVLKPFDRMRRRRNQSEYPAADSPSVTGEEIDRDTVKVEQIIDLADKVLDQMSPYG